MATNGRYMDRNDSNKRIKHITPNINIQVVGSIDYK